MAGRWLGALAGLAVTSWALQADVTGTAVLLASPILGVALLAAVLAGELLGRAPAPGPARRALLETRRVADYLPAAARPVAALLVAYAVLTAITLAPDAGSTVVTTCGDLVVLLSPWPEPGHVLPALATVLLGLGVAALGLRQLVDRPRPAGLSIEQDDRARRESAAAVVAACAVLVAGPLAGTALIAGSHLVNGCGGVLSVLLGWGLLWLAGTAALAAGWALVALLRPRRGAA